MTEKDILRKKAKAIRNLIFAKKEKDCINKKSFHNLLLKFKKNLDIESVGIYYPI